MAKSKVIIDEELQPWEMQPTDTAKSYAAFKLFRDMNPTERSLKALQKLLGHDKLRVIYNWSSKHNWHERLRAFDNYNDAIQIRAKHKQEIELLKRQAKQVGQVSGIFTRISLEANKRLSELVNSTRKSNLETMTLDNLMDLTVKAANSLPKLLEAERIALGIHPKINIVSKIDLTRMSDEELTEIARGE